MAGTSNGLRNCEGVASVRVLSTRIADLCERLDTIAEQLESELDFAAAIQEQEKELGEVLGEPGLVKERADMERSLNRFPVQAAEASEAFSREVAAISAMLDQALHAALQKASRVASLPERINQAVRQRQAVLERISRLAESRLEEERRRSQTASPQAPQANGGDPLLSKMSPLLLDLRLGQLNRVIGGDGQGSDLPTVFVSSNQSVAPGTPVHLRVVSGSVSAEGDGYVLWVRNANNPEQSGFAVRLIAVMEEDREAWSVLAGV